MMIFLGRKRRKKNIFPVPPRAAEHRNNPFSLSSLPFSGLIYAPRTGCQGKPDNDPRQGESEVSAPPKTVREIGKPGAGRPGTPQAQQEVWPGQEGFFRTLHKDHY
jgi:hypothetical protein